MSEWTIAGKPALILLHMQHAICDPQGSLAHLGHAKAAHESGIIPNQQRLLKAFRAKKLPVIYVNSVHDMSRQKDAPTLGRFWATVFSGVNLPGSKDVEVIGELASEPGEPVLGNFVFSMFASNNLDAILRELGVRTLVLAGVATNMAVLASSWAAADLNYNLVVPSDACTGADYASQEAAMKMISAVAMVAPTEKVLACVGQVGPSAA